MESGRVGLGWVNCGARHRKKRDGLLRQGERVKFAFLTAEKATYPARVQCRTLQVSRAGFYAWHRRPPAARTQQDQRLGVEIQAIHAESRQRYGSPRVHAELRDCGQRLGRKRVARLRRQQSLCARRRRQFRVTTDSQHDFPVAPNVLARQFAVVAPATAWVTDITSFWTREGWLYLAMILDLFSRAVVGWAMSAHITRHLTLQALTLALGRRRPPQGLLHHSDRHMAQPRIGFLGMGAMGGPMAGRPAQSGFSVTGYDVSAARVEAVRAGYRALRPGSPGARPATQPWRPTCPPLGQR
jgi:hypothetical protein